MFSTVCPQGFEWLNQQSCIAVIDVAAGQTAAQAKCKELNPFSSLTIPKTFHQQELLQTFAEKKSILKTDFFLGMTKAAGYWIWDDGSPLFVKREQL